MYAIGSTNVINFIRIRLIDYKDGMCEKRDETKKFNSFSQMQVAE